MKKLVNGLKGTASRRSFIKGGLGTASVGAWLLAGSSSIFGQDLEGGGSLTKGDVAILRFLAAAEIVESDLWLQYAELGGTQDSELPGLTGGSQPYSILQFHDPLTTSRPRITFKPSPTRRDSTLLSSSKVAAAFTHHWHKGSRMQRSYESCSVSDQPRPPTFRLGTTRRATPDPSDPTLVFPALNAAPLGGENFQTNLIMPEPAPFLSRKFLPVCSVIRGTETNGAATAAIEGLIQDGLFIGQSPTFLRFLRNLATAADNATRGQ